VEDDEAQRAGIAHLIGDTDVAVTAVGTGEEALEVLKERQFDCVVLDLTLPDMGGFELLKKVKGQERFQNLPVIIYTSKDLSRQEKIQMKKYAATIITKDATSPDRLLDETALFLHRVVSKLPEPKRAIVEQRQRRRSRASGDANGADPAVPPRPVPPLRATSNADAGTGENVSLAGRKVLIVDDDVRNIFALTALLESHDIQVEFAENGKAGIEMLSSDASDIELVLMDVMMPEQDGYETTLAIRAMEQFRALPIIALTAKAMEGDREKCLAAGASDYIAKPVNNEQLLSLLRRWLGERPAE
jgi:CheY-like chemotaxis protein